MLIGVLFWWSLAMPLVFLGCFLWWRSGRRWIGLAATWGCIVGFVGFAIGFFGTMLWAPDANQGPLLGIFVTGPFGFAATSTVILVVGALRDRSARRIASQHPRHP